MYLQNTRTLLASSSPSASSGHRAVQSSVLGQVRRPASERVHNSTLRRVLRLAPCAATISRSVQPLASCAGEAGQCTRREIERWTLTLKLPLYLYVQTSECRIHHNGSNLPPGLRNFCDLGTYCICMILPQYRSCSLEVSSESATSQNRSGCWGL